MKSILKVIVVICFVSAYSCATVKLSDSWTSNDFENTRDKKILIVARSKDKDVRKMYEDELVRQLKAEDINAVSALNEFPDLKENKNPSEAEKAKIVKQFTDAGIEAITLLALKDTKVTYVDDNSTQYDPMIYNRGRYGISFVDYYNVHYIEYLSKDISRKKPNGNPNEITENPSYSTYILEAVIYDITLSEDEQLIGSFEVESKEPKSAEQVLNNFTKIVSKQFKK